MVEYLDTVLNQDRLKVKSSYEQIEFEQIEAFEERSGITLPNAYKRLLLKSNGGVPDISEVSLNGKDFFLQYFFPLSSKASNNIDFQLEYMRSLGWSDFVPIAQEGPGNRIGFRKGDPRVWLWDNEKNTIGVIADEFSTIADSLIINPIDK